MVVPKFRALDKNTKKMNGMAEIYRNRKQEIELLPRDDDIILMQSTGLFDNSTPKKEIFEGDIVETIYNGKLFTGVIVYDQEETDFKATNGHNEYGNNFRYLGGNDSIIVIGNIYQNPELMEENK